MDELSILFKDDGLLVIDGVRCSIAAIKSLFNNPPSGSLLNIKREGDQLIFSKFDNADASVEFFNG